MKTTTADSINIFLMIVASIIAVYLPFDLLLVSYAFLGLAHYLTEIGWLKDRHFFTTGKLEIFVILVLALLSIIGAGTGIYPLLVCCAFVIPVVFKFTFVA